MRRLQIPLVAVTAALLIGSTSAGVSRAAMPKPVVKNVNGWISALAMDGSNVAYATQAFAPTNCFKLFSWNPLTKAGALVSGLKSGNCGSDTPNGQRIVSVALAGPRVAWIRNISGNTESDDYLYTRVLGKAKQLASATRTGDTSGILSGKWLGGLVGSGSVLAVNTWTTGYDRLRDDSFARLRRAHEGHEARLGHRHAQSRVGRHRPRRGAAQQRVRWGSTRPRARS